MHFAEFGVVMMLFVIGLELQPSLLWRLRGPILGLGGLQVTLTSLIVGGAAIAAGPAVAVRRGHRHDAVALVHRDRAADAEREGAAGDGRRAELVRRAAVPGHRRHPDARHFSAAGRRRCQPITAMWHTPPRWISNLPAWGQTLAVLAAVGLVVGGGRFVLGPVFRQIARTRLREIFTAAALLLVIGIALLMTAVGLSPALGTFLAGVVLANSEYRHELESDIDPFKGLLLGLFFIAVGASIDFGLIVSRPAIVAGLVAAIVAVKFVVLFGAGARVRARPRAEPAARVRLAAGAGSSRSCCSRSPTSTAC